MSKRFILWIHKYKESILNKCFYPYKIQNKYIYFNYKKL